jgi:hypothetical protein
MSSQSSSSTSKRRAQRSRGIGINDQLDSDKSAGDADKGAQQHGQDIQDSHDGFSEVGVEAAVVVVGVVEPEHASDAVGEPAGEEGGGEGDEVGKYLSQKREGGCVSEEREKV